MRSFLFLLIHLLGTLAKLLGPGGLKAVLAENLLIKHQLLVLNRNRRRAPALAPGDRICLGWLSLFIAPRRLLRAAVMIKPSTLLRFHQALIKRKYSMLFSSRHRGKPGPLGPSAELISAIMAIKLRIPPESDHPFRCKLDTDSRPNWTRIPVKLDTCGWRIISHLS